MPPTEARVWNLLRTDPFVPFHFRRQVPLGRYFADFASHNARLVVEIDGDLHFTEKAKSYDDQRDRFIRSEGFEIVRVTNLEVMNNLEGVAARILQAIPLDPATLDHFPHEGEGRTRAAAPEKEND